MLLTILILSAAFAAYVIYTHSEKKDANGVVLQSQVIITPKSCGLEVLDLTGIAAGSTFTVAKRTITWSAERNAFGAQSLADSGWQETKGATVAFDRTSNTVNTFIDTTWFTADKQ